jgi:stage II sporulation protein AB (anti-sigma F factor)
VTALNEMQLEFLSKSQNEAFARVVVAAFASQLDPTLDELADIKTAVSEAVTNCIIHGYEDTIGTIRINSKLYKKDLTVYIR